MNNFTNNMNGNKGNVNISDSGSITSTNTINEMDKYNIYEIIEEFQRKLSLLENSPEEKEEISDDMELLKEEIKKENISKNRIDRIIKRVSGGLQNIIAITASATTLLTSFEQIKSCIEKLIS